MPIYNLNGLGPHEFERMAQALIKAVVGPGATIFGPGRDGGREATFSGRAPYPSQSEQWAGDWIFQAKFHDTDLLGVDKARRQVIADLGPELDSITRKYKHPCDNYVVITNVPLTSVPETGTRARMEQEVFPKYSDKIRHFAVWGADDVSRLLDTHPGVRTAYLHFIVPGDVVAKLLKADEDRASEVDRTILSYIQASFTRDQYAQLDQAGDVADDPVRLQTVFFDLASYSQYDSETVFRADALGYSSRPRRSGRPTFFTIRLMLSELVGRVVLIGGPGEGKSTLGQYLAQLHRATLLRKPREIALDDGYVPAIPRLPFRVILRDYGQWLAGKVAEEPQSGLLDEYICDQVRMLTGRTLDVATFHRVLSSDPVLLILDGLDEVTDVDLKKVLLARVNEFTERCHEVYKANLQILATSRPARHLIQFEPRNYVHLRLAKLEPPQVVAYVERWTVAKDFDPAKANRVLESIRECLADPQIQVMATTPLQVTILAVIIALGGTPPRQREALFNEYLEVIYKRETAKGRHIIQSEKEQLIGLHKFVGYMLHEKATTADAMSAAFTKPDYERVVQTFLAFQNPYAPADVVRAEHKAITQDAGDRLVLIVEPIVGQFGFELRSIQEFFAGCHLLDTSKSTEQRYRRFEAISRLSHWRNVALFFAGRVGRNYSGEISNLVEVCRAVDREGPDRHLRRGSELALELAADRAFGPNARGQRSLLELGLLVLETDLSPERRTDVCELLQKLPPEDIRDHISVLLRQKVELLSPNHLENVAFATHAVHATELTKAALTKMAEDPGSRAKCLRLLAALGPDLLPPNITVADLIAHSGAAFSLEVLTTAPWRLVREIFELVPAEKTSIPAIRGVIAGLGSRHPQMYSPGFGNESPDAPPLGDWGPCNEKWSLFAMTVIVWTRSRMARDRRSLDFERREGTLRELVGNTWIPESIGRGEIPRLSDTGREGALLVAPLWIIHLWFGDVSIESLLEFCDFYATACWTPDVRHAIGMQRWCDISPALDIIVAGINAGGQDHRTLAEDALPYAGCDGARRWSEKCVELAQRIEELRSDPREGAMIQTSSGAQETIRRAVAEVFPPALVGYALRQYPAVDREQPRASDAVAQFLGDGTLSIPRMSALTALTVGRQNREAIASSRVAVVRRVLSSERPDAAEILLMTLPSVLANGKGLSDEQAMPALQIIGELGDADVHYMASVDEVMHVTALQRLMAIATSDASATVMRGALRLLDNYSVNFDLARRASQTHVRRPRYKGFADAHRRLLESEDAHARRAGLMLFLARPPSNERDIHLIGTIVVTDWGWRHEFTLSSLMRFMARTPRLAAGWISELTRWLDLGLDGTARAFIAGQLGQLLSASDQSLSRAHESLGLPLQS